MSNPFFQFKQFIIYQDQCAMKVTTDACLFGAWAAGEMAHHISTSGESPVKSILDIGTGTALLPLMLAQKNAGCVIDGLEIDKPAFEQATQNVAASPWSKRIHIIHADARAFPIEKKYDVIISNPPFYENELQSGNKRKDIAHHGESLLLADLLQLIELNLAAEGLFFILLPYKRKAEIESLLKTKHLTVSKLMMVRPSLSYPFSRIMIAGSSSTGLQSNEGEISIKNDEQQYTPEFVALLKDYYLHL